MIINIGSRIIPPPLSRALKKKCLWTNYCESQINKTSTSAMRLEESDVIIPCYHKRSALIQELELEINRTNISDYSLYFQYYRIRSGKHPMCDCDGTLVPFPLEFFSLLPSSLSTQAAGNWLFKRWIALSNG